MKETKGTNGRHEKRTQISSCSSNGKLIVWDFSETDNAGDFPFEPTREDFKAAEVLSLVIAFSRRTWSDIARDTHDAGKSKHHFLSEAVFSQDAIKTLERLNLRERTDEIYSMRLDNKTRIIGLRSHERFIVKWYDPEHKFVLSKKK